MIAIRLSDINPSLAHTSPLQKVLRVVLGVGLVLVGISHLTFARGGFQAQVPDWLPIAKDFVVVASGIVEIALGLALTFVFGQRVNVGWLVAAFFVIVFPGNVHQYIYQISAFGLDTDTKRLIRLFLQPMLVVWAFWCTGAWSNRREWRHALMD